MISTLHSLCVKGKHFGRQVPAVVAVQNGFQNNRHIIRNVHIEIAVITIIDGYEPYSKERKDLFQIVAHHDVVSGEAGKILYNDTM